MRPCWWLNVLLLAVTLWRYNDTCAKVLLMLASGVVPTRFIGAPSVAVDSAGAVSSSFFERLQTFLIARAPPSCCTLHPLTGAPAALFQMTVLTLEPCARRVLVIHTPQYIGLLGPGVPALLATVPLLPCVPIPATQASASMVKYYKMPAQQNNLACAR